MRWVRISILFSQPYQQRLSTIEEELSDTCLTAVVPAFVSNDESHTLTSFPTPLQSRQGAQLNVALSPPPSTTSAAAGDWNPETWKTMEAHQMPHYDDAEELQAAVKKLERCSPLVFAGEVRTLHENLARACQGQGFLLMGGDCAEAFNEFNVDHVRDTFRVILQMALVLTFGSAMPVIKVGRMAGQFAKPRSDPDEVRGDVSLPSYRGDIINREDFTPEARRNNPFNMVEAYHQSAQTLNILRAFSTGGYADISRLHAWNLDFVEQTEEGSRYVLALICSLRPWYPMLSEVSFTHSV
jgi:3-deoxy-7-phosphoheptulonate synthase